MPDFLLHIPQHPIYRLAQSQAVLQIGRMPGQDIVIDDPLISREHARLFWREGVLFLEDLGSKHGSFVNGTRIRSAHPVAAQDEVRLGGVAVRFEVVVPFTDWTAETLALPVADLRSWLKRDTSQAHFQGWREALDLLHEVSLLMLQDQPSEGFLCELLDRLFAFLDASRGAVLLRDGGGELALLASRMKENTSEAPLILSPATLEAALERREALLLKEPRTQPTESAERSDASSTSAVMAVPLEHGGEVLGLFYFDASRTRSPFTEDDLRFVASLGNLAAAKLLQLRLAEELRRKEALEQELVATKAAAQAKSEFLAHMSHEIRTPMNAILGFTHIAMGETQTPRAADCLRKIDHSSRSLMTIINDILDVSKMEAGKLRMEAIPFRLAEVLRNAQDLFLEKAEEQGLDFKVVTVGEIPEVLVGDPLRLGQVLINLVGNALKFTEHGRVELRVEPEEISGPRVCLRFSVQDTGIGLAPEQIDRLFTAFAQADSSTTRRYGGTGLGLTISRRLVEMMDGSIQVVSEPAAGSTFSFTAWFPVGSEQECGGNVGSTPAAPSTPEGNGGWRVLLVEDNSLNQELGRILLEDAGGQVDVASNGFEAMAMVDSRAYDAVLMDVEMPGMDGCETTRRIRERHQVLPIIAMTAHALSSHRSQCLAAGMSAYLSKPIDPKRLMEVLGPWITQQGGPGSRQVPRCGGEAFVGLEDVMDVPTALERLDGRSDLLLHLLRVFQADPSNADSIRKAMAAGNGEAARLHAHNVSGMAGSLAIGSVEEAAKALEACLRSEDYRDWAVCCDRLGEALEQFQTLAARVIGSPCP